jgi:hypothetical protein
LVSECVELQTKRELDRIGIKITDLENGCCGWRDSVY